MKNEYTINDGESKKEKWNRSLDLFIESVHKPDSSLRNCAHNQKCYHELMDLRKNMLEYLQTFKGGIKWIFERYYKRSWQ